tara:strand:+ start:3196 stop:3720 length:525 start_codon:yes stop_codon:yes gene_type:complete
MSIQGNLKQGCFLEILERIKQQLDAMLSHHCKILVVRLDLHVECYRPDNEVMSKFIRKVRKKLCAYYDFNRLGFIWVREQEKAKQQHYHLAFFMDANKVRYPDKCISICERIAKGWELFIFTPKNCYYLINRGDSKVYQDAFYRLSYLSKERGKGCKAKAANDYSASRIKMRLN